MTEVGKLVLEGRQIKLRLQADRRVYRTPVHVDWLRFTLELERCPLPEGDVLFPSALVKEGLRRCKRDMVNASMGLVEVVTDDEDKAACCALGVAGDIVELLGEDFSVNPQLQRGRDFYKYRWSITRNDVEVGWVGFLASSNSPSQRAQALTVHVNMYGMACTFARHGWREGVADYIKARDGRITRVDLALDFFDGIPGGLDRVRDDYLNGAMAVLGKNPRCNMVGEWIDGGRGRSFYFGSKEAGKQTNVYEKGVQLFGREDPSRWERVELRYGNKLRVLPVDVLTRPADFFAGASDWHAAILAENRDEPMRGIPEGIPCRPRLAIETVQAELSRCVRWLRNVAAPSLNFVFSHLEESLMLDLIRSGMGRLPGRLAKFKVSELSEGLNVAAARVLTPGRATGPSLQPAH